MNISQLKQFVLAAINSKLTSVVQTGSFVGTLTGCTTSPTSTFYWQKVGNLVSIIIPGLAATSNTTAATITGMPKQLWPAAQRSCSARVYDNSVLAFLPVDIETTGVLTLHNTQTGTNGFTAAGSKGVALMMISYLLR